ncbi:hypothetical protein ES332_D06G233500v1 [Gossypium tomentosum]|uniref:Uncharacterized protein n=1 Tax=Gossypium tomentosum TaxID=34277 RepID=A0A5D2KLQ5_GOSTO|nr:hypothetical protein ES332_D06G233500v1 [Gossypium tomentosum]
MRQMPKKGKKNGKGSAFSLLCRFQHRRKCPTASYEATQVVWHAWRADVRQAVAVACAGRSAARRWSLGMRRLGLGFLLC